MKPYNINLNLKNTHNTSTGIEIPIANRDSVIFNIFVHDDAQEINYTEYSKALVIFKKNNKIASQNTCTLTDKYIICNVKTTDYDVPGIVFAELWLYIDDVKEVPIPFNFKAIQSKGYDIAPSESTLDEFDNLLKDLETMKDEFPNIRIIGESESEEQLNDLYPDGADGSVLVGNDVYYWNIKEKVWINIGALRGEKGEKGDTGAQGDIGAQGEQGLQGEKGDTGDTGAQGIQGVQGEQGIKGDTGAQGERGIQGIQGDTGAQGEKGEKGDTGAQGVKGDDGKGVNVLGSYSSAEELRQAHPTGQVSDAYLVQGDLWVWSETENNWANAGTIQGAKGDTGEKGEKGDTGAQGEQGIQGIQGEQGAQGEKGDTGAQGEKGDTGAQGEQGIQGIQGDTGLQGEKGDKGEAGEKGDTGAQGEQGIQGIQGEQGFQGIQGVQGIQGAKGDKGEPAQLEFTENSVKYKWELVVENGILIYRYEGV